jgi:hypothetical protein
VVTSPARMRFTGTSAALAPSADPRRHLPARNFQDVSASLVVTRFRGAKGLPELWCVGSWLFEADVELFGG